MAKFKLQEACKGAKQALEHGDSERAIAMCQHIVRYYPRCVEAYRLLGEAYLEHGDTATADKLFSYVMQADPQNVLAHIGRAIIREERGEIDAAISEFERAFEIDPAIGELRGELLRLYTSRFGTEGAKIRTSRVGLAHLYARDYLFPQAVNEYSDILRSEPRLDVRVALALTLWRSGNDAAAADLCNAILQQVPNNIQANLILGQIWLAQGQRDDALSLLRRAMDLDPDNALARDLFESRVGRIMLPPLTYYAAELPQWEGSELSASSELPVGLIEVVALEEDALPSATGEAATAPQWEAQPVALNAAEVGEQFATAERQMDAEADVDQNLVWLLSETPPVETPYLTGNGQADSHAPAPELQRQRLDRSEFLQQLASAGLGLTPTHTEARSNEPEQQAAEGGLGRPPLSATPSEEETMPAPSYAEDDEQGRTFQFDWDKEGLPDYLKEFALGESGSRVAAEPTAASQAQADEAEGLPSWLTPAQPAIASQSPAPADEGLPPWLVPVPTQPTAEAILASDTSHPAVVATPSVATPPPATPSAPTMPSLASAASGPDLTCLPDWPISAPPGDQPAAAMQAAHGQQPSDGNVDSEGLLAQLALAQTEPPAPVQPPQSAPPADLMPPPSEVAKSNEDTAGVDDMDDDADMEGLPSWLTSTPPPFVAEAPPPNSSPAPPMHSSEMAGLDSPDSTELDSIDDYGLPSWLTLEPSAPMPTTNPPPATPPRGQPHTFAEAGPTPIGTDQSDLQPVSAPIDDQPAPPDPAAFANLPPFNFDDVQSTTPSGQQPGTADAAAPSSLQSFSFGAAPPSDELEELEDFVDFLKPVAPAAVAHSPIASLAPLPASSFDSAPRVQPLSLASTAPPAAAQDNGLPSNPQPFSYDDSATPAGSLSEQAAISMSSDPTVLPTADLADYQLPADRRLFSLEGDSAAQRATDNNFDFTPFNSDELMPESSPQPANSAAERPAMLEADLEQPGNVDVRGSSLQQSANREPSVADGSVSVVTKLRRRKKELELNESTAAAPVAAPPDGTLPAPPASESGNELDQSGLDLSPKQRAYLLGEEVPSSGLEAAHQVQQETGAGDYLLAQESTPTEEQMQAAIERDFGPAASSDEGTTAFADEIDAAFQRGGSGAYSPAAEMPVDATPPAAEAVAADTTAIVEQEPSAREPVATAAVTEPESADMYEAPTEPRDELTSISSLRSFVDANRDNVAARLILAHAYADNEEYDNALEHYRLILKSKSLPAPVLEGVVNDLQDLLNVEDLNNNPHIHRLLGDAYMKQGLFQHAINQYNWLMRK